LGCFIHVGLNAVDPISTEDGTARSAASLTNDMRDIAVSQFTPQVFLTTAPRRKGHSAIQSAAKGMSSGDTLLLTYSGHGGQVPDVSGDEADSQDETWVLYDRELLDDELYQLWAGFPAGADRSVRQLPQRHGDPCMSA
jgi:hypothetical protein